MNIFVTGAAGFIGYSVCEQLLARGNQVFGLDNLNAYYSVKLKTDRLNRLLAHPNFRFIQANLEDRETIKSIFDENAFDVVINLAAQAGVRYSLINPQAYIDSNITGFCNILEGCRHTQVKHLVFASSSSIYGANALMPFSEHHPVDHPISLYGATKRANELMAHSYASLYNLPITGLRFFTVYGPWGRPDMALFKFTQNILTGTPIEVYNHGNMIRDFTYIQDIVEAIIRIVDRPATPNPLWDQEKPDPATSYAPYRIYNIGNSDPVLLSTFINAIEDAVGKPAIIKLLPMQAGDVPATHADVSKLYSEFDFKPCISVNEGIKHFVQWYRDYFKVKVEEPNYV